MACLTRKCCIELHRCGIVGEWAEDGGPYYRHYACYDRLVSCTRSCYERELTPGSNADKRQVALTCGEECVPQNEGFTDVSVLECALGVPTSSSSSEDAGIDDDMSSGTDAQPIEDGCIDECFD